MPICHDETYYEQLIFNNNCKQLKVFANEEFEIILNKDDESEIYLNHKSCNTESFMVQFTSSKCFVKSW